VWRDAIEMNPGQKVTGHKAKDKRPTDKRPLGQKARHTPIMIISVSNHARLLDVTISSHLSLQKHYLLTVRRVSTGFVIAIIII